MKEIVVISGKGGTGKTTMVASFAALAESKVMVDCDVDAADLDLLLKPIAQERHEFWSGQSAAIDRDKCLQCDICQNVCRFGAISEFIVNSASCEGCAFCYHVCPADAVTMRENLSGQWFVSDTRYGPLVHARLGIAQENSGKMVATVRQQAKALAKEQGMDYILSDGPPGTGCPVISSISGVQLAIIVTEPTLSGMHDLERIIGVCHHFSVPAMVCINKYDVNEINTRQIEDYCHNQLIDVAAEIPYDNIVIEALVHELPVVEYAGNGVSWQIKKLWQATVDRLAKE